MTVLKQALLAFVCLLGAANVALAGDFPATCRYFSGLAFNDQHTRENATFRTTLAAECGEAFAILVDPDETDAAKREAAAYLETLQRYREVLFEMVRDRYDLAVDDPVIARGRPVARPVTRSGEILIARVMGLTEHHRTWLAWRDARAD